MANFSLAPPILNTSRILWRLIGANMNSTADQAFSKVGSFTSYLVFSIRCANASISLTTAVGGLYDTASKGGTALVANSQAYSTLTSSSLGFALGSTTYGVGVRSGASLFLSLTTPQGSAATADFYVLGVPLS